MRIPELFQQSKKVFSLEVFPPKKDGNTSIERIFETLDGLKSLHPDFISVTYGANGSKADTATSDIASYIQNHLGITACAHLTCAYMQKEDITAALERFQSNGIENILALRGDINPEIPRKTDFMYAGDLAEFIKENRNFSVSGACYPECHPESPDERTDICHLKEKVERGVEHLVTQLFFDNTSFYAFRENARAAGIHVPIEAGIMPVVNKKQIERIVSLCGASLPVKFSKMMQKYEHNPEALRDAGIAYAVDQITDLLSNDVDGIHLYTMNNLYVAKKISESIKSLL